MQRKNGAVSLTLQAENKNKCQRFHKGKTEEPRAQKDKENGIQGIKNREAETSTQ